MPASKSDYGSASSHTWPRSSKREHRISCHYCDTAYLIDLIEEGKAAHCQLCGQVIYRNRASSLSRAVAFGLTAFCLWLMMNLFPFISMDALGNKSSVSVPGAVLGLWMTGGVPIAIAIVFFVLVLPLLLISVLLYLCLPLLFGKAPPFAIAAMRGFQAVQPWVMVEVFFLGAMISLLKLVKLAEIDLGVGFWAVMGLMLCMAGAVGGIDKLELWDRIELALERRKE
ncbi:paraquat-inducible protein A [Luteolibacter algae]|uniref:Paraquat-inducible protein A n=1 Tax=Luteolibacter algae TaxID=454151 RepID=A0ABW5D6A5_9BACT